MEHGGVITDAVSTQPWPGDAVVEVSIVNWVNDPSELPRTYMLDEVLVEAIDTALEESTIPVADVPALPPNGARAFQGSCLGPSSTSLETARSLLTDGAYVDVVRPYLDGRDIARRVDQTPSRYVIDFGQTALEAAMKYPAALDLIRQQAKPVREASTSYGRNPRWCQFLWPTSR